MTNAQCIALMACKIYMADRSDTTSAEQIAGEKTRAINVALDFLVNASWLMNRYDDLNGVSERRSEMLWG